MEHGLLVVGQTKVVLDMALTDVFNGLRRMRAKEAGKVG